MSFSFSSRRTFLGQTVLGTAAWLSGCGKGSDKPVEASVDVATGKMIVGKAIDVPPMVPPGCVQAGDVTQNAAMVWGRSSGATGQMVVEWTTSGSFEGAAKVMGPQLTAETDFTGRVDVTGLPPGKAVQYRVSVLPGEDKPAVEVARGKLKTAPDTRGDLLIAWSGDCCGQGWGINPEWGGLRMFETIRAAGPDLFLHCGDVVYADRPMPAEVALPDGTVWKNHLTPAKTRPAETLEDYRGNYAYNLLDPHYRAFLAEVPMVVTLDDHEVVNNWYPGRRLDAQKYKKMKTADDLSLLGKQAFFEYTAIREMAPKSGMVYRKIEYGPLVDVFVLDERSYRGPDTECRQTELTPESAMMGAAQVAWLKGALSSSKALWKVLISSMPIGCEQVDSKRGSVNMQDGWGNGEGPPLGREIEWADVLRHCKGAGLRNLLVVTAEVHYAAAHLYSPETAVFKDFDPFWEFVAGPLHSQSFGPLRSDPSFGLQLKYRRTPRKQGNLPPSFGYGSFGTLKVAGESGKLTVTLHDPEGAPLYTVDLQPVV